MYDYITPQKLLEALTFLKAKYADIDVKEEWLEATMMLSFSSVELNNKIIVTGSQMMLLLIPKTVLLMLHPLMFLMRLLWTDDALLTQGRRKVSKSGTASKNCACTEVSEGVAVLALESGSIPDPVVHFISTCSRACVYTGSTCAALESESGEREGYRSEIALQ